MDTGSTFHSIAGDVDAGKFVTLENANPSQPARGHSQMEVSGSDTISLVVSRTAESDSSHMTGGDVGAEDDRQPLISGTDVMTASFPDAMDGRKDDKAALDTSKSYLSEVIVIDGGETSNKEEGECEWSHVNQANTGGGKSRDGQTAVPNIQCNVVQSAGPRSAQAAPCGASSISSNDPGAASSHLQHFSSTFRQFHQAVIVERPYGCNRCTKRFFLESDLQKHTARHTREKPYTCLVCSKSFICQSQLDVHHNVHTGERPFSCSICSRRFSHPSNLKRHQKLQH